MYMYLEWSKHLKMDEINWTVQPSTDSKTNFFQKKLEVVGISANENFLCVRLLLIGKTCLCVCLCLIFF